MNRLSAGGAACLATLVVGGCAATMSWFGDRGPRDSVRVVLQITVDQLRADLALGVRDRWSPGGFRWLYDKGAVFSNAHHAHANTETIVGHATLATGADPAVHGMIGNVWFDRGTDLLRTNVEDARFATIGDPTPSNADGGHPGQARSSRGRSPEALLAPTIADAIAAAGGGQAKVFAVSLKDRAAVPMAGRSGKALWWSDATGEFVSSTYYYPEARLPDWVQAWNRTKVADRLNGRSWKLLLDRDDYVTVHDDMPWEEPPVGMSRMFPHRLDRGMLGLGFYSAVGASPFGDDLLLQFTRELLTREDIGRDDVTDYLSVGFSSCDFIGHRFGPSSLEYEDAVVRIDRTIAALLRAADEVAGPGRTLVVLSSDHGIAEAPEALMAAGRDAGLVWLSAIERTEGVRQLNAKFGGRLVRSRWTPYVYLDVDALRAHGVDREDAARELAVEIQKAPGVEAAFTRGQIIDNKLPNTDVARAVRRNFHAERSGDIHVVPKEGWQIAYEGDSKVRFATGHGTPWRYDTWVPIVFAGPGVKRTVVKRRVETIDVAPTIAALLGVQTPSGATGKVLTEALR
ncbi:MAG: alkaline phosphatase family protein [Candidatus Binatia bacterium]